MTVIGWSLGNGFIHFLTHIGPPMDQQSFSTMRYLPPWGIFWTLTFLGVRSFPPRATLGCIFLDHQTFATMRNFLYSFNYQLKKLKKRVSHHCSDIRLILNKSLTTSQHKQVTPCNWYFPNISGLFWVQGVFHPEIALAASFLTIRHFPPFPTQLRFLGSRLNTSSRNMKKLKESVSHHCSNRIIYIRLIQKIHLPPPPPRTCEIHPAPDIFKTQGILHPETLLAASFWPTEIFQHEAFSTWLQFCFVNYQLKHEKVEKKGITTLLR